MLLSVILEGGSPMALLNVPAGVIVLGGTLGATLIAYPFSYVVGLPKYLMRAILDRPLDATRTIESFVDLADKARREGLLALEREVDGLEPFERKGLMMVVDGTDPSVVREVMETEIEGIQERHRASYGTLEAMGGFAPTMGIIGTVMGLVNVLQKLEDPTALAHSIAVAFIATLYGVTTANLLWLPLASKLKQKSELEVSVRELTIEAVMSVQAGDNPRLVREKLEARLPAGKRNVPRPAAAATAAGEA